MRKIDGAHAAAAQQAVQHVGANTLARRFRGLALLPFREQRGCALLLFRAGGEQHTHLGGKFPIPAALRVDQFNTRIAGNRKGLVEDGLDALKTVCLGIHIDAILASE